MVVRLGMLGERQAGSGSSPVGHQAGSHSSPTYRVHQWVLPVACERDRSLLFFGARLWANRSEALPELQGGCRRRVGEA